MRHSNKVKKLNRPKDQRVSLVKNLMKSILKHGTINTTEARYKVVRSHFDKLINTAKSDDNTTVRRLFAVLRDKELCEKAMDIAKGFDNRNSGYLRAYKLDNRKGDNAKMVRIEIVK